MDTIAKNLRYLRLLAGIKQEVVAQYLDIEQQAYSKFENNRVPKVEYLQKLATFYRVNIEDITKDKSVEQQQGLPITTRHPEASGESFVTQNERDLLRQIISAQNELIKTYEDVLKKRG